MYSGEGRGRREREGGWEGDEEEEEEGRGYLKLYSGVCAVPVSINDGPSVFS